ncbi:hypothetical protein [Haladaptatus cibarius]|uniref:hypothetical protein n=1 Tax=Haladaptatus cibarius TaxID=453847 RepID=UPI000679D265|nr:hypothetical protein [Haladaptatus cibarius]
MRRRNALQQFGLVAALASTGGCASILGGGSESDDGDRARSGDLETIGIDSIVEGDNGNLVVVVNIENHGDSQSSAKLNVAATIGETVHEKTPEVTVPGGQTKGVRIPFEVEYSKYEEASRTSIDLDLK